MLLKNFLSCYLRIYNNIFHHIQGHAVKNLLIPCIHLFIAVLCEVLIKNVAKQTVNQNSFQHIVYIK